MTTPPHPLGPYLGVLPQEMLNAVYAELLKRPYSIHFQGIINDNNQLQLKYEGLGSDFESAEDGIKDTLLRLLLTSSAVRQNVEQWFFVPTSIAIRLIKDISASSWLSLSDSSTSTKHIQEIDLILELPWWNFHDKQPWDHWCDFTIGIELRQRQGRWDAEWMKGRSGVMDPLDFFDAVKPGSIDNGHHQRPEMIEALINELGGPMTMKAVTRVAKMLWLDNAYGRRTEKGPWAEQMRG